MANRLTRDQVLIRALNLVDSPRIDEKDRSGGLTQIDAAAVLSPGWLQDALDLAYNLYPFQGVLKTTTFNITAGTSDYSLATVASDFVLDFKDGVVLPDDKGRLRRSALNALLNYSISSSSRGIPARYAIHNGLLVLRPVPRDSYTAATLYYYSLPTVLSAATVPNFPNDLILVEYVHLRGREWLRELPAGTAEKYLIDAVARLQKSGLGPEAEMDDVIGVDRDVFPGGGDAHTESGWFTRVVA